MRFEIYWTKLSNLYSFVSNLSQWNELVCIPQRKKEWLQKTGKLIPVEKMALKEFSQIFQATKINLEPIFLFENPRKVWPILSKKIGRKKSTKIKSIFRIFKDRLNKIWNVENKKLEKIAKEFTFRRSQINNNLEIIRKLCDLSKWQLPKEIKIRLILSSAGKEDCQGWSFKEIVVLECSGWPIKKINYLINSIFLHECFHILFKKNKGLFSIFKSMIGKNSEFFDKTKLKIWTSKVIFEEALISSFLPEGYLGQQISKTTSKNIILKELSKKRSDGLIKLRRFCASYLYDLAKEYIKEGKSLDKFYFAKVINCVKNFISKIKKGRRKFLP